MNDALRAASVVPAFAEAIEVHLVETSPVLAQVQKATLARLDIPVFWHSGFETVPPGPAIIIANEFFDALPVRHYVNQAGAWRERLVGLDGRNDFTFGLSREAEPSIKVNAPEGSVVEIGAIGQRIMNGLAARLAAQGGAALIIDYGYEQTSLGETLQALQGHQFVDPLAHPGEADLTTHVDFAALARAARAAGAQVHGPITQGVLLSDLGIFDRARALSNFLAARQTLTASSWRPTSNNASAAASARPMSTRRRDTSSATSTCLLGKWLRATSMALDQRSSRSAAESMRSLLAPR
jgi:SAM-dependent MidA family methyltransferase